FFSSRRRHTRSYGDWSSDVCSSDLTLTLVGLDAHPVRVEVESRRGPASFDLVGLPEVTVKEARVRVRSALGQLGVDLSSHCLTEIGRASCRERGEIAVVVV